MQRLRGYPKDSYSMQLRLWIYFHFDNQCSNHSQKTNSCLWCQYEMYLAYITIINKKLESPRSSHTVISLIQAHFYVCGIVSDIDYESPFLHVCVSYIQHWDVRICGKIFYGMWNINVILFVIQYIYSHFDALLNILQFTILCVWQNINLYTSVKPLYRLYVYKK